MRTKDAAFETKDLAVPERPACFRLHKSYAGTACPSCGLEIPVGPYTSEQMEKYLGQQLYNGQRRADQPDPADVANPPSEREVALRAEWAAMTARYNAAKINLSRVENGLAHRPGMRHAPAGSDPVAHEDALSELEFTERECERLNRAIRREEAERQDRIRGWQLAKGQRANAARA